MAGTVKVKIIGDTSSLEGAIQKSEGLFSGLAGAAKSVLSGVGMAVGMGAANVLAQVPGQIMGAVNAASDLQESLSKSLVLFGDWSIDVEQFAESSAKNLGQSKQSVLDATSTFATFGKAAGLSGGELFDFSKDLTVLASDMASFGNTTPEQAIEAIGAALRGEAEPIRSYGVLLDDATLRQKALEMGIISTTKEALTPAQKVLAAQAAILDQTTAAQGDFARTSEGAANQQRILAAQVENLKGRIGSALLPVFASVVSFLSGKLVPWFEKLVPVIERGIGRAIEIVKEFWAALSTGMTEDEGTGVERFALGIRDAFQKAQDVVSMAWPYIQQAVGLIGQAITSVAQTIRGVVEWFQADQERLIALAAGLGAVLLALFIQWAVSAAAAAVATLAAIAPIILLGAAIAGLVAIFVYAYRNWEWFRTAVDAVAQAVVATFNWLADAIGAVISWVTDRWSQWGDEITGIIRWAFDLISNYITSYLGVIRNTIGFFINLFTGDWSGAWNSLQGIFSNAWNLIWGTISRAFEGLLQWNRWLYDLGRNLIQSMINGVGSMAGALKDKVTGIAGDALGAIGGVFGIGSPSKVMIQYGRWIMEGLMIGEEQGMKRMGGLLGPLDLPGGFGGHSAAAGMAASGAATVSVAGQAVTDRDLVILVKDGLREFDRERR